MSERKPPEYYNTAKLWYPEGNKPAPEERFYSDPNVERGVGPALSAMAENVATKMNDPHGGPKDPFGFDTPDRMDVYNKVANEAEKLAEGHMFVWNKLIENKSPMGIHHDTLNPNPRVQQLMTDPGFETFLSSKTIADKINVLKDVGIFQGNQMNDQDLAEFLLTHIPDGLTEDPQVSEDARRKVKNELGG